MDSGEKQDEFTNHVPQYRGGDSLTRRIVSAIGRKGFDTEDYEDFIQTDAAINPGNSGGALINARGKLIGINTAIISGRGGGNQGIGFAIPINMARSVMDQILRTGHMVRGHLGVMIQDLTPQIAQVFHVPQGKGALISGVEPNGPGAKAGLQREDVIEEIDGKPVIGVNELWLQISQTSPGSVVHLKVLRDGHDLTMSATLGELHESSATSAMEETTRESPMRGVQVDDLKPAMERELGLRSGTRGVLVTDLDPDSPALDAGLHTRDVIEEINHQPVANATEYRRLVRQAGSHSALLLVNHRGNTTFRVVEAQ